LIVVIAMYPFYLWLVKKIKSKVWSSIIASMTFLLLVVVPFGLFFVYAASEAVQYFSTVEVSEEGRVAVVTYVEDNFPVLADTLQLVETDATNMVAKTIDTISSFLRNFIVPLTTNIVMFFVNLTFFMLILIYLFPDKKNFFGVLVEVIPLDKNLSQQFIDRFVVTTQKMVISVFLAAMAQGVLGGFMFWILGIPAAGFWTIVMTVVAFLPLGSGLVWVPAGILLVLTGHVWQGIVLLLWGMIVISSVDNLLRGFMLRGGKTQIPEIITFISALGGIVVFGFFGFIYGPVLAAGFLTALDIYREYRRKEEVK
ncbi:MAG: AI-2E family transporter, partial [Patescibacteria group bacterium]|nr:AI-2E family transporter [Patescibacteria group bacterium]